jgi:hypothetical protein
MNNNYKKDTTRNIGKYEKRLHQYSLLVIIKVFIFANDIIGWFCLTESDI